MLIFALYRDNAKKNTLKTEVENQIIDDPQVIAEKLNVFFKQKVQIVANGIRKDPKIDSFQKLREKLSNLNFSQKFKLKTVHENELLKILKSLKPKKNHVFDGISSEILKLGAEALKVPLTYIINSSILSGKFPSK